VGGEDPLRGRFAGRASRSPALDPQSEGHGRRRRNSRWARAAGWEHPNCQCRLVAYSPGLTIPQDDTTYDEVAEKERAQQRAFEREIRSTKRREASAMTDTARRKAAQDVRAAQSDMRDFIRDTGRKRQSYREQLGFADGRGPVGRASAPTPPRPPVPLVAGDRVSARTLGDVRPSNRGTQTVPSGAFPRAHELATGERLARAGISAERRVEDFTHSVKNPDVTIDGHAWASRDPRAQARPRSRISSRVQRNRAFIASCSTSRVARSTKRLGPSSPRRERLVHRRELHRPRGPCHLAHQGIKERGPAVLVDCLPRSPRCYPTHGVAARPSRQGSTRLSVARRLLITASTFRR